MLTLTDGIILSPVCLGFLAPESVKATRMEWLVASGGTEFTEFSLAELMNVCLSFLNGPCPS